MAANQPNIIVFSGKPATGKTTLSNAISKLLNIPRHGKDDFKEVLFTAFDNVNRELSKRLGKASNFLLYHHINSCAKYNIDVIIDSNFVNKYARPFFLDTADKYDANIIEIFCDCDSDVLKKRFFSRAQFGGRNPMHGDKDNVSEMQSILEEKSEPLNIGHSKLECYTSAPIDICVASIADFISKAKNDKK